MNTIFKVVDPLDTSVEDVREVEGVGQATCSVILKNFRTFKIVLLGFINTNREFFPLKIK